MRRWSIVLAGLFAALGLVPAPAAATWPCVPFEPPPVRFEYRTVKTYRTEYRTETYQAPVYRQEPVYDTWLTWEEDHWEVVRTPVAQGGDTTPEWPAVDLHNREREGARTEELVAVLEDEDGRTRMTLPPETWTALDVGDPVRWRHGPVTGTDLLLEP